MQPKMCSFLNAAGQRSSWVWLTGALCSPLRLPLALILSLRKNAMMTPKRQDLILVAVLVGTFCAIYFTVQIIEAPINTRDLHWTLSLILNLISYSAIFLPAYLVMQYVKKTNFMDNGNCLAPAIKLCFFGNTDESIDDSISETKKEEQAAPMSELKMFLHLVGCFFGLQFSYLTWGVLQEKIMTQQYVDSTGNIGHFKDSQFLVFVNRILAFAVALLYITATRQPRHKAPLYKYSYCSFSNIMSSWCQYEALKFISFPTQVLAKASKIIPVMIMSWFVSNKKYEKHEYFVAVLISFGMVLFLSGSSETVGAANANTSTTFSGFLLLIGYMTCDAFTSNWQKELFNSYKINPVQAMCGVNLFSCLFTSVSLLQQGAFFDSLVFMSQFPKFTFDCVVLSFCSAIGQLFIYHTINVFGPVIFVIIMTLRQAIAILLSCIIYGHVITALGVTGVLIVFLATFLNIYCGYRLRRQKKATENIKNLDNVNVTKA